MTKFASTARAALLGLTVAVAGIVGSAGLAGAASASPVAENTMVIKVQSRDGQNRRVTVHNQTGWTMLRFYASDSRVTSWEEDMLGRGTLAAGSSMMMNIDDGSGACLYDFKAEFTNGEVLTRMNVNVCQIADYYYTR